MDLDNDTLKKLARRDTPGAAVLLVESYYERVYAFLRRLAGNDADAADLTQRTFARVQQALLTFAGRSSVSSWVHGIAYHTYVDWRRSDCRVEPRSDEWWGDRESHELPPDEVVARADFGSCLYGFVDRLASELRDSIHLHYYQGLTLQETADAMGVATSTVKYRLRQALDELQKQFSRERSGGAASTVKRV
jgi:RNA polymerase sigma-70 factor, ECF subfamily